MIGRILFAVLRLFVNTDKLWRLLDTQGIVCFVGPNGSGKSLSMVAAVLDVLGGVTWECIDPDHRHHKPFSGHAAACPVCGESLWRFRRAETVADVAPYLCDQGRDLLDENSRGVRRVFSTVALLAADGRDHPRYVPLRDYRQLLTIEHSDVLFDEVAGVSDASDSASIPVQVVTWLHQMRKRDVRLRVTTPAYDRCSKPVRQICQVVVDCRSFFPERRTGGRLWRPRRGFILDAYDAFTFDRFTHSSAQQSSKNVPGPKRLAKGAFWRPGHPAELTYNTLGQVLALGHVNEAGMCTVCGGTRSRPKCGCDDDALHDGQEVEVIQSVSPSGVRTRKAVPVGVAPPSARLRAVDH